MTTTIVISQDNNDNEVALLVDDIQSKPNIICLCTKDEECDSDSGTCRLNQSYQMCYESWTLNAYDGSIDVTAGYVILCFFFFICSILNLIFRCMRNEYFFTRLMCSVNQTKRIIICCSERDYCNDLDAYSKEIRNTLLNSISTSKFLKTKNKILNFNIEFIF
jgi:hypothetical protein